MPDGPWTQYQQAQPAPAGPWQRYQSAKGPWTAYQPKTASEAAPASSKPLLQQIEDVALAVPREIGAEIGKQKADIAKQQDIVAREFSGKPVSEAEKRFEREQVAATASGLAGAQDIGAGPIAEAVGAERVAAAVPKAAEVAGAATAPKPAPGMPQAVSGTEPPANPPARPETSARAAPGAVAKEGPLSKPPALGDPALLAKQFRQFMGRHARRAIDAIQAIAKLPDDITPEMADKFSAYEESKMATPLRPGEQTKVNLTPREQQIYEEHFRPIQMERQALSKEYQQITGKPFDEAMGQSGYIHHGVLGRERSYGEAVAQFMKGIVARIGGPGRTMRTTIDADRGRRFFIAENTQTGEKEFVAVMPDRNVLMFDGTPNPKPFGRYAGQGHARPKTLIRTEGGDQYILHWATMPQIEALTKTRYVKNAFTIELDQLAKIASAVENAKFLNALKADPQFSNFAVKADEVGMPPQTGGRLWRRPNLMQFQSHYVDPRIADVMDDAARAPADPTSQAAALSKVNQFVNGMMFLNPLPHDRNIVNWSIITRGLVGNIIHAPRTIRTLIRAIVEVHNGGPIYKRALDAGLSDPYSQIIAGDLQPLLIRRFSKEFNKNPPKWNRLARSWGYLNTKEMLKRWAMVGNRNLWALNSVLATQRFMEHMEGGAAAADAIERTHAEIPSYIVPPSVGKGYLGRAVSQFFNNPLSARFGRYQFWKLQTYMKILRNAFGPGVNLGDRAHAFDQLAMIGVYYYMVYPVYDWVWQKITHNPLARTVRAGGLSMIDSVMRAAKGETSLWSPVTSAITPGIGLDIGDMLIYGRYGWSGAPVVRDPDARQLVEGNKVQQHQVARDILHGVLGMLSTPGELVDPGSRRTLGQIGLGAIGVKSPTADQQARQARARAYDERQAKRRAYKQEYGQ